MLPEHAPFTPDQRRALDSLIIGLDPLQRGWLSGYLAAVHGASTQAPRANLPAAKLTVLYGTESGNCEVLADRTVKAAKKRGFQAVMKNMSETSPAELSKVSNLLVLVSTWGDGEAPETAMNFYKEFMANELTLNKLQYSVCALGDTSYEKFCQTGKEIDARLEVFGANRIFTRQDCDVDYEDAYVSWLEGSLTAIAATSTEVVLPANEVTYESTTTEYGKKNAFVAETLESLVLNGEGSAKETIHLEFSLAGSGLIYEPGDALAVIPVNAPDAIKALLQAARLTGNEEVDVKNVGTKLLADALREDFDITALSRAVLTKLADAANSMPLHELLADDAKQRLKDFNHGREIVDAIEQFAPSGLSAKALAGILRKLPPRLYSIASSPLAHPGEVHLTVAAVRYEAHGRSRKGVCSTYLADLVKSGDHVPIFVQPNKNFRLPTESTAPVIMVGPGTGVAPFRAFVEHRAALESKGENWLIFGDQHYTYDFLYQLEWQEHLKNGILTRLDVAFSRDQPEKIYVQDRMMENAKELYRWLEAGAYFYVCGDANRMAHDVHEALLSIVEKQGNLSREQAESYVENLKKTKRYQRDVY
jgi:sulfite reductase (NADPH) flavoprotein alpha-component